MTKTSLLVKKYQSEKFVKSFYDKNNLLRVKTRISSVETFSFDKKFLSLLNKDNYITMMIVLNARESVCHSSVTSTFNFICSEFWIVKDRQTMKKILTKCFICKYFNEKVLLGQAIPYLTDLRVKCNHSFEFVVGVDFAGPIYDKDKNGADKADVFVLLFT